MCVCVCVCAGVDLFVGVGVIFCTKCSCRRQYVPRNVGHVCASAEQGLFHRQFLLLPPSSSSFRWSSALRQLPSVLHALVDPVPYHDLHLSFHVNVPFLLPIRLLIVCFPYISLQFSAIPQDSILLVSS